MFLQIPTNVTDDQDENLTTGLQGNNLIFANYINKNAPQDAFYFVPAQFDDTLSRALESAAPTRNALSLYTASNNMFYITKNLSSHLRSDRFFYHGTESRLYASTSYADLSLPEEKDTRKKPYSVWFDFIGVMASQKAQHQTAGFKPSTGGAILAFDARLSDQTRVGGGATYLYTHIHENRASGHSNINQEDLFVYATWENKHFYVDGSLIGGVFLISQIRKIHMTGFEFASTSNPFGGQLVPHIELGYVSNRLKAKPSFDLSFNPFVMVDWANAWQASYEEKGNSPFNIHQKSSYSSLLRTEASLRIYETLAFNSWNLILQEKGGYVNTQSYGAGKTTAFLLGSPGSFTVETLKSAKNAGIVQLALIASPHNFRYPTSTLFYQGELSPHYKSHELTLEFTWTF